MLACAPRLTAGHSRGAQNHRIVLHLGNSRLEQLHHFLAAPLLPLGSHSRLLVLDLVVHLVRSLHQQLVQLDLLQRSTR